MAVKITLEDGDDKVVRVLDEECITWDSYILNFIICLRGLGFSISGEKEEKIMDAVEGN